MSLIGIYLITTTFENPVASNISKINVLIFSTNKFSLPNRFVIIRMTRRPTEEIIFHFFKIKTAIHWDARLFWETLFDINSNVRSIISVALMWHCTGCIWIGRKALCNTLECGFMGQKKCSRSGGYVKYGFVCRLHSSGNRWWNSVYVPSCPGRQHYRRRNWRRRRYSR